jgi:hypothetical protein
MKYVLCPLAHGPWSKPKHGGQIKSFIRNSLGWGKGKSSDGNGGIQGTKRLKGQRFYATEDWKWQCTRGNWEKRCDGTDPATFPRHPPLDFSQHQFKHSSSSPWAYRVKRSPQIPHVRAICIVQRVRSRTAMNCDGIALNVLPQAGTRSGNSPKRRKRRRLEAEAGLRSPYERRTHPWRFEAEHRSEVPNVAPPSPPIHGILHRFSLQAIVIVPRHRFSAFTSMAHATETRGGGGHQ